MNTITIAYRFAVVCLLFAVALVFPVTFFASALVYLVAEDIVRHFDKPAPLVHAYSDPYQELKSAFDEIFEEPETPTVPEVEPITFTYHELQTLIKNYYSADERAALGIKLNAKRSVLEYWLPTEYLA